MVNETRNIEEDEESTIGPLSTNTIDFATLKVVEHWNPPLLNTLKRIFYV